MSLPITLHATFRENWSEELKQLAVPSISFPLLPHEIDYLGQRQSLYRKFFPSSFTHCCTSLDSKIESAFETCASVFPRLSFCSWKTTKEFGRACTSLSEVLFCICQQDDRIDSYLTAARTQYTPIWLHLVQWRCLAEYDEVRLFICNRKLIGASAYHENKNSPISKLRAMSICWSVKIISERFLPHLPLDSVIVDCLIPKEDGITPEVLELNPFGTLSSAGHFSWEEPIPFQFRSLLHTINF